MTRDGHIELDRAVESIQIGARHRQDLGDLDALCESIDRLGLLQPITITPDGILICGRRRLAAITRLGWHTIRVWVRSGISTRIEHLLAERDENMVREPLPPTEAATLYDELRTLLADDASQRKEATHFTGSLPVVGSGPVESTGPESGPEYRGEARAQAARMVTGRDSHERLDRVAEVQQLATDHQVAPAVREVAQRELEAMDQDHKVAGHYTTAVSAHLLDQLSRLATDHTMPSDIRAEAASWATSVAEVPRLSSTDALALLRRAHTALAQLTTQDTRTTPADAADPAGAPPPTRPDPTEESRATTGAGSPKKQPRKLRSPRAFRLFWSEIAGWHEHYDPAVIGPALRSDHWETFLATVHATQQFAEQAEAARQAAGRDRNEPPAA